MKAPLRRLERRPLDVLAVVAGAALLRVVAGVGFANYDTLYALAWGGQLARGETPAYGVAIAPTPHPLLELVGLVLYPLGASVVTDVTIALGFLALSACAWVVYELGSDWFGRAAGALAALLFITRAPVLSYGVRAYVDIPYLLAILAALLVESRRRRAGAPVLALFAIAGLLRPEAWAFSGLYWLYLIGCDAEGRWSVRRLGDSLRPRRWREIAGVTALAASAPLLWIASDLAVTGDPLWSLTNTRHTATTLHRVSGIVNVPEYIPRRIGEILRPPVLVAAALGGVLASWLLRRRALLGAGAGVVAVLVFALFAAFGLPINTRYAFAAAAILCIFAGAGVFGWTCLPTGEPPRRWLAGAQRWWPGGAGRGRRLWAAAGALALVALIAYAPSQYRKVHGQLVNLKEQRSIEDDLIALVRHGTINLRCGPVGVPNHAPIPLLALYMKTSPANVVSLQTGQIASGVYVDPASSEVEARYVLDPHDPHETVSVPPGFAASGANRSWLIFSRCR